MNSKLTPREQLAAFDDEHGEVVINALAVYAEHMRETADEALKGARRPEQRNPADLRDWGQEDLLVLARAAGMLWHSTSQADPLEVLSERQAALLNRASTSYLTPLASEPEPERGPAMRTREHKGYSHGLKPGTSADMNCPNCQDEQAAGQAPVITGTISVRPTSGGFAAMALMFTDAAARADAARTAYERLTGRADEDEDRGTASTAEWFLESRRHGCTGTGYSTADDTIEHRDPGPCPVHPGL
jgi:hypothetical protein